MMYILYRENLNKTAYNSLPTATWPYDQNHIEVGRFRTTVNKASALPTFSFS